MGSAGNDDAGAVYVCDARVSCHHPMLATCIVPIHLCEIKNNNKFLCTLSLPRTGCRSSSVR